MSAARMPLALAMTTTAAAVVMAGAAAAERGTTPMDTALITTVAALLALGAHLLPALARMGGRRVPRAAVWPLWLGCIAATLYGHSHFMLSASQRAGDARAEAVGSSHAAQALQAELAAISARPLAQVAADKATADGRAAQALAALARCEQGAGAGHCPAAAAQATSNQAKATGLGLELAQAQHAAELRSRLVAAAGEQDGAQQRAATDPVDAALAQLTGWPLAGLSLGLAVMQALLLDLLAALLWSMALAGTGEAETKNENVFVFGNDDTAMVPPAPARQRPGFPARMPHPTVPAPEPARRAGERPRRWAWQWPMAQAQPH